MFELSWSKACGCVPIPHTVYLHYILTSKHMPLIHLSKGLLYCSYFILILFLIIFILFLIIIIHYHHLFTPHSSSSSTSCPAILFQWMWGNTNISVSVLQIESNLLVLGMTIPPTKQLHLSASTALCIYSTPSLSYWSILTLIELFQHVMSTSYLLKAFGILYAIQSGHEYSTPPPTLSLCHVTACVLHIGVLVTLLVGDDSNLLWNFFNMSGPLRTY